MQIYKHTQVGTLILVSLGVAIGAVAMVLTLALPMQPGVMLVPVLVLVGLLVCMILFCTLTVEVSDDQLVVSFGPGWIRRRFQVERIHAARIVRNPWYYGWGIRWTPHGWLFNVAGLDAVELELEDRRKFRIGTDDPEHLLTAIERVCGHPS